MKCVLSILGVAAGLSLATVASASVTYTFATSNTTVASGSTYCATFSTPASCSGKQTVTVYSEQTDHLNPGNTFASSSTTLSGLFTVTDSPNAYGTGIAPYDPQQGGSPFSSQDGIDDSVGNNSHLDNIVLLKLSDFASNSTLSLLLQAGVSGDTFNVYTYLGNTAPTSLTAMNEQKSNVAVDETGSVKTNGSSQPTTPQVTNLTIAGLGPNTTGWIAIEADCHYLLLTSLTVGTATPEPRFYGILLAGLLGFAGMAYNKRRAAKAIA